MKIYQHSYIGFVDILGYRNVERSLSRYGPDTSTALISRIFNSLDRKTDAFNVQYPEITWMRYGDSYLCYSHSKNEEHLVRMVKDSCVFIASALHQEIPLRMALTQNHIHIDTTHPGGTVSGPGWDSLRDLEGILRKKMSQSLEDRRAGLS